MKFSIKSAVVALIALAITPLAIADDANQINQKVLERLQALEALVREQQQEIESMRSQLVVQESPSRELVNEVVEQEVQAAIDDRLDRDALAQIKDTPAVTIGKTIDALGISADLRLRAEQRNRDTNNDRTRYRQRFRVGGKWQNKSEDWEVAAGLATGGGAPTSTNDTFSDGHVFETGDIRLDYAYSKHKWENVTLTLGQQKSPWKGTTTEIMWDSDVRPVGATAQFGSEGAFITTGLYNVFDSEGGDAAEAVLLSAQAGMKFDNALLAVGYWHYNEEAVDYVVSTDAKLGAPYTSDMDFHLIDAYGKVGFDVGDVDLSLYGHYVVNVGADGPSVVAGDMADDNNQAYKVGIKAKAGKWEFGYAWKHAEADAVFQPVADSDFGSGLGFSSDSGAESIDAEGHELKAKYKLSSSVTLEFEANLVEEIDSGNSDAELYQFDLIYKF